MTQQPHKFFCFQEVVPSTTADTTSKADPSENVASEPRSSVPISATPQASGATHGNSVHSLKDNDRDDDITVQYIKENDFPEREGKKYCQRTQRTLPVEGIGYYKGSKNVPKFMQSSKANKNCQPPGNLRSRPEFKLTKAKAVQQQRASTDVSETEQQANLDNSSGPSNNEPSGSKPVKKRGRPPKHTKAPATTPSTSAAGHNEEETTKRQSSFLRGIDALTTEIVSKTNAVTELSQPSPTEGRTGVNSYSQDGSTVVGEQHGGPQEGKKTPPKTPPMIRKSDEMELSLVTVEQPDLDTHNVVTSTPISAMKSYRHVPDESLVGNSEGECGEKSLLDTTREHSLLEGSAAKPKRGRGRPPKLKKNLNDAAEGEKSFLEEPVIDTNREQSLLHDSTAKPKRGRGRPPKVIKDSNDTAEGGHSFLEESIVDTSREQSLLHDSTAKPKKRRGRPPKVIKDKIDTAEGEKSFLENSVIDTSREQSLFGDSTAKPKRGRPPKKAKLFEEMTETAKETRLSSEESVIDTSRDQPVFDNSTPKPKRPRGRPKKIVKLPDTNAKELGEHAVVDVVERKPRSARGRKQSTDSRASSTTNNSEKGDDNDEPLENKSDPQSDEETVWKPSPRKVGRPKKEKSTTATLR